jgi:outer membrane immunogenic protein
MKKILLVTASLIALGAAAPAVAADLAARPYTKAPPMIAALYDWSGFYIGANGGWGSSRNCWDILPGVGSSAEGCHDSSGGTVGGQIGYRWQAGTWVFGLEAQGNWADFTGNNRSIFDNRFRNESRVDAFGLFTGQIGYAANNVLFYVKGGAAVTSNDYRAFNVATNALAGTTADDTRWGGTVGVGLEYGFAPNWSVGVEYNHLFMQDRTYTFTQPGGAFFATDRISQNVDLVTARLNYKFGGPAIARY